ncbi:MAG: type IV pilus assembly protein PilM [Planctomycetota bacterium]
MAARNEAWGIEIGSSALKAIQLTRNGDQVAIGDYEVIPFKPILTTPDLNVAEAIQVNLDAFLAKHDVRRANVVVSVPGNMAFGRFAKLPPVEPKQVPQIVEFEAKQQIPFPIEDVEWDYQVFQDDDNPDVEVGIFAITKERVMEFLSNFNSVGITVESLTLSPLAVFNAFAYEAGASDETPPGSVLVDIGTQSTDVIIVEGGRVWLRTLPMGGNDFTEALCRSFKLSFPKAEKLKLEARTSKYARQIFQAMRPVFADLVQEVQRSIGYYQSLNRESDLKQIIGFGSTFRLPGLQKFLKQQLQMDVIRPDGFDRIQIDGPRSAEFAENALNLATAYGLALQGVGLQSVDCNIMPSAILHRRIWQAKQPWFAAAAGLLLVASLAALGKSLVDTAAFEGGLASVSSDVRSAINEAQSFQREFNEVGQRQDARRKIENISRMLDYRELWPMLLTDITEASHAGLNKDERFASLLTVQYEDWENLPERTQWPRLFIDSIDTIYTSVPPADMRGGDAEDAGTQNPRGGQRFDPMAGGAANYGAYAERGNFGQSNFGSAGEEQEWRQTYTAADFFKGTGNDTEAPVLRITIQGTTPFANASTLITNEFVGWLKENAERDDRPYTFVIPDTPITSLERISETDLLIDNNDRRRGASVRSNATRNSVRTRPVRTPGDPMASMSATRRGSTPTAVEAEVNPPRPVPLNEPPYYRFEVQWFVMLKPPRGDDNKPGAREAEIIQAAESSPEQPAPADPAESEQPEQPAADARSIRSQETPS